MIISGFKHQQSAHCENGVITGLLRHQGIAISEPMAFGLGAGLFFTYLPFIRVNHAPAISYRPMPGFIFSRVAKIFKINIHRKKFSNPEEGEKALLYNLKQGIPTGLQVGVFHLPYFPEYYRFHFNAHNLIVYGHDETGYHISDPVMEEVTILSAEELTKVRYAKGVLAPKGHMYYLTPQTHCVDWHKALPLSIKKTCRQMLVPVPIAGVRAIFLVANRIRKWPKVHGVKKTNHYLAQIIRMQEEIGTGGGGFRYIYAAFLQEAAVLLANESLMRRAEELTEIGDLWRNFALKAARICKGRIDNDDQAYELLADLLQTIGQKEKMFYKRLKSSI